MYIKDTNSLCSIAFQKIKEARFMEIKVAGDSSLVVKFGNEIDEKINQKVRAFRLAAEKRSIKGIIEYIKNIIQ